MRLTLRNFRYHRSLELDLPATGVVLFSGPSGNGKSTVLAALEWLFYGKLRKVGSFDEKRTSVSLEYDGIAVQNFRNDDGEPPESITIMRQRDPTLLQLTCGEKIYTGDEAQEIINRLFGSEDVFISSCFLKQGERSVLLDGKTSDKMQLVEQFTFNSENIGQYKTKIAAALKEAEKSLDGLAGGIKILEGQIESFRVLNERQLTLLSEEHRRRGGKLSQETLESDITDLTTSIDVLWKQKNELEVQERSRSSTLSANSDLEKQIKTLQSQIKGTHDPIAAELATARVKELVKEAATSQLLEEYQTLRVNDARRSGDFKKRHGTVRPDPTSPPPSAQDQHKISSELGQLEQQQAENERNRTHNLKITTELATLQPPSQTVEELTSEREVASLLEEYSTLGDCSEEPIENHGYPEDIKCLDEMLSTGIGWLNSLTATETVLGELQAAGPDDLSARIVETKARLENCGSRLDCPQCKAELIYSNGSLRSCASRKAKALPARLGMRPPTSPVATAPMSPCPVQICTDPPETLIREIAELERALTLCNITPPADFQHTTTASNCQVELAKVKALRHALLARESKRPLLNRKKALEVRLAGRSTDRKEAVIAQELKTLQRYNQLQTTLKPVHEVNTARISELKEQLALIDQKRDNHRLALLFVQQEELELQARQKRLELLKRLYPEKSTEELLNLDEQKFQVEWREPGIIDAELTQLQAQIAATQKAQELTNRIEAFKASLRSVPESVTEGIATITEELEKQNKRSTLFKQIRTYLSLEIQLKEMDSRLVDQQRLSKDESKKYAALDKLRRVSLQAESISLESTISIINQEMAEQLQSLFSDPITVRFENIRMLANGTNKFCINLVVNYRGKDYDDIRQLSGGEAARVSLAITLALNKTANAPMLLLDESLSGLDPDLIDTVIDQLKEVSDRYSIPIMIVAHGGVSGHYDNVIEF